MDFKATEGLWTEKREYPRIRAGCPIRYQFITEDTWQEATLIDYSATGARIKCEELILKGTKIRIEVLPGCVKNVPPFTAEAVVVRFALDEDHNFQIGCTFNKPISSLMINPAN